MSNVAIADIAITAEFETGSHHAGTNVVNHTRLEMKAKRPITRPHSDRDLKYRQQITHDMFLFAFSLLERCQILTVVHEQDVHVVFIYKFSV